MEEKTRSVDAAKSSYLFDDESKRKTSQHCDFSSAHRLLALFASICDERGRRLFDSATPSSRTCAVIVSLEALTLFFIDGTIFPERAFHHQMRL